MTRLKTNAPILIGFSVLLYLVGIAAAISTHKTKVTFGQSVRVPGKVLTAGTYYFEAPNTNVRTIVKISDESGSLVTQFTGIPDYTHKPTHDIVTFGQHECGPRAVKSWFYPGDVYGVRFVYSKQEAELIAAACNEPVPETHESTRLSGTAADKVYLITPQKQEEEYTPEALSTSDQMDQNGFDGAPTDQPSPPQ